jgi:hypothetical protein
MVISIAAPLFQLAEKQFEAAANGKILAARRGGFGRAALHFVIFPALHIPALRLLIKNKGSVTAFDGRYMSTVDFTIKSPSCDFEKTAKTVDRISVLLHGFVPFGHKKTRLRDAARGIDRHW